MQRRFDPSRIVWYLPPQRDRGEEAKPVAPSSLPASVAGNNEDDLYLKSFFCPVDFTVFENPVLAQDGFIYEKRAIERWLRTSRTDSRGRLINPTSPMTNLPLTSTAIQEMHTMRQAVAEFKAEIIPRLKRLKDLEQRPQAGNATERQALLGKIEGHNKTIQELNVLIQQQVDHNEAIKKEYQDKLRDLQEQQNRNFAVCELEQKRLKDSGLEKDQELHRLRVTLRNAEQLCVEQRQQMEALQRQLPQAQELNLRMPLQAPLAPSSRDFSSPPPSAARSQEHRARLLQESNARRLLLRAPASVAALSLFAQANSRSEGLALNGRLIKAVMALDNEGVCQALDAGASVDARQGLDQATALILAVRAYVTHPQEAKAVIEFLLARGAQVDLKDRAGNTALHCAAFYKLTWPIKLFLEKGANPTLRNLKKETPRDTLIHQANFNSRLSLKLLNAESRWHDRRYLTLANANLQAPSRRFRHGSG